MKKNLRFIVMMYLSLIGFFLTSLAFLLYATLLGPRFFYFMYNYHLINTQITDSDAINYCLYSLLSVMLGVYTVLVAFKNEIKDFFERDEERTIEWAENIFSNHPDTLVRFTDSEDISQRILAYDVYNILGKPIPEQLKNVKKRK